MSTTLPGQVALLAELFAAGGWKDLRIESAGLNVLLSADGDAVPLGAASVAADQPLPVVPVPVSQTANPPVAEAAAPAGPDASTNWTEVRAPNLGTFYRSPKPGSAPFVEIGQKVSAETELCLLEVMKLFTSVKAGASGTIRKVCVEDGILVEGGQVLFLIEAD
ncbi:MAG: acetyl-CoA carboxylase, biotin carboxyl carrier protein [Novosphingobium sp.]|nr:acetyl-CoA carboxylase, biotin carboxyl carrier protein [Novosphingobium sp.]